jgi:hypothetical protein
MNVKRALVIGFYCTIGDIDSLKRVTDWLSEINVRYTVAPFGGPVLDAIPGSVLPETVNPKDFTHVIIVCGPCDREYYARRWPIDPAAFAHCHFIGVNLSMIQSLDEWDPFDTLLERDSSRNVRPDLTMLTEPRKTPVFGLCIAPAQPEYKDRQMNAYASRLLRSVARKMDAAVVMIDTGWPKELNDTGLESEAQIESLIARVDVLLTTRLHGTVYAIKNQVPPLVLDPIRGGDKVIAQARVLGWPSAYLAETVTEEDLIAGLKFCMSPEGKRKTAESVSNARILLADVRKEFMAALESGPQGAHERWPERIVEQRSFIERAEGVSKRYVRKLGNVLLKLGEPN